MLLLCAPSVAVLDWEEEETEGKYLDSASRFHSFIFLTHLLSLLTLLVLCSLLDFSNASEGPRSLNHEELHLSGWILQ